MLDFFLVIVGLGGLIGGGDLLLRGAVNVATALGMSRVLIGLTIISLVQRIENTRPFRVLALV